MAGDVNQIVLESMESEDANLLRAACVMAGVLKISQAERGLIKALNHKAWQIQAEAAKALGLIESKGALKYLRQILKASDADLRQKMLAAAAGSGPEEGDDTNPEVKRQAAIAINRIDPANTQQALMTALASDQPKLINAALSGLGNLMADAGEERLLELLGHSEADTRSAAAAYAGRVRMKKAVPKLMEMLEDPEAGVRREVIVALNHIKAAEAIEPLADRLQDNDTSVRRVAAIALGNTRSRDISVVGALIKGLSDRDAEVRTACLSALANLKAEKALEAAAGLLGDSHEQVRKQAGATVSVLGKSREQPDYQQ
ncbi:MAG: HEAT repeat domain-containing protein [Desulfarculaceae bacterium]|jgi:HEAT repeat protein